MVSENSLFGVGMAPQSDLPIVYQACFSETIQDLDLDFSSAKVMGNQLAGEVAAIIAGPHILPILKSFQMPYWLDDEGVEELLKPFQDPPSALECLRSEDIRSDAKFEHISGVLASSTSLKTLQINYYSSWIKEAFTSGYTKIASALCSNQSLKSLVCRIFTILELKAKLDPLLPKTNNLQHNTTFTKLVLKGSIGGKEGIETLANMICTNSSLLELDLFYLKDLSVHGIEGIENVLTILEALKTNKSLKKINFRHCKAVGGYKVLGAMMDLLLENHCIEDIDLHDTSLEELGDADYVYSALLKRKKVKLWNNVQGMANVKPTSGRVFLCGNPLVGKTTLQMAMKELKEFQGKDQLQNRSRFREKLKNPFKTSIGPKVPTKDLQLERTRGIEVDSVLSDDIGITIWDMAGLCREVKELNDVDEELAKGRKEFVAILLNDGGHIIYNEQEKVVITNPHWFCHDIIEQFLYQCAFEGQRLAMVSSNGIMSINHARRLILKLVEGQGDMEKQFDDILGMMIKLHICYEQDANHIMIPSTLRKRLDDLCWSKPDEVMSFTYVGRRLACKDRTKTMLTPGFFTRLQVSFFKMLQTKNAQDTYEVFQDVIKFISEGIEAILQFNHGNIDILLRSHQCQENVIEFLENKILMHIKHLQSDSTLGCPGVLLEDYILRPACVEKLLHLEDRKYQFVHIKDLEVEVIKNGVDATHNWKSCKGLDASLNRVKTLLGDLAWKKLLEKRSCHLQEYYMEIQSKLNPLIQSDPSKCIEKNASSTSSLWRVPQRLLIGPLEDKIDQHIWETREQHKKTMSKLEDVVQMIQSLENGIKNMQVGLLQEVCSRIDDLMEFSMEMKKSQIPKLAYLCESGKQKLLTRWVLDLHKIQLHLMCENRQRFHKVANQEGCVVNFGSENTKRFLAMLVWGLKIATILTKIGAHVACGMGAMVPDLSDGVSFTTLILDTPGFLDYEIPTTTLDSLPEDLRNQSRISIDDGSKVEAQRWLRDFLELQHQSKREFYNKFKLRKVRYRVSGSIAWICDECISKHHNEIDELE